MNSGATSERVYDALKRRVLERAFRPGERLDPARLGEELHSSVTPVRDVLHILTGERLVETRPSNGFHMPSLDAPALQDLYQWNAQILLLAISAGSARGTDSQVASQRAPVAAPVAAGVAVAGLFARIARSSANEEHRRAVASASDRLHAVRLAEPLVFDDIDTELAVLANAFAKAEAAALRRAVTAYHRRRRRQAPAIVRALYRHN